MAHVPRRAGVLLSCCLALAQVACGEGSGMIGVMTRDTTTGTTGQLLATVQVTNDAFVPNVVNLRIGGTVSWIWVQGATNHNVSFNDPLLSSGTKNTGTHSVTFSTGGTFNYSCTVHPGMIGSIVVQ